MASQESPQRPFLSESESYGSLDGNAPIQLLHDDVAFESPQLKDRERKISTGMMIRIKKLCV